jgi:hypothetical protein
MSSSLRQMIRRRAGRCWKSAVPQTLLDRVSSDAVRFIKLGRKSVWWPLARDTNTLRLGFRQFDFAFGAAGEWEKAKEKFASTGARTGAGDITRTLNQVRDFFELPESVLWCTMEDADVWLCFAETKVVVLYTGDDTAEQKQGARMRRAIDRWRNTELNGNRLRLDSMTTKITKVASFQETICRPSGASNLLNRIQSSAHARAAQAHEELVAANVERFSASRA